MGRSRSRSPPKGSDRHSRRHRSSSRDRKSYRRDKGSNRSRSPVYRNRSRSPRRHRSRSPVKSRGRDKSDKDKDYYHRDRGSHSSYRDRSRSPARDYDRRNSDNEESGEEELTDEEKAMMKVMGFAKFNTTKGKHVPGSCNASAANIKIEKKYRQYMNRRGGFNRPLDPMK